MTLLRLLTCSCLLPLALAPLDAFAQVDVRADRPHRFATGALPPPRFADPDRARKLAAAFPDVQRILGAHAERRHMPGFAFGIVVDGELVFAGSGGIGDLATGSAVDADTVFRIASMTKSFTAMAILKLRDDGRLSLDDPAAKWVPELATLPYPTRDSPAITVRDLLTHSAGFPEDNPWGDRQLAASDEALDGWLRGGIPFSNAPGVAFEYSNYGFAVLGRIVLRASGLRYREYVDAQILRPLGMSSTFWEAGAVPTGRLARGYRWEANGWKEEVPLADGAFGSMGGLFTSIHDLARYVSAFMTAWPPRDDAEAGPIRRTSLREMQQVARFFSASATRRDVTGALRLSAGGYGYGLDVSQDCRFPYVVSHGGGLPGYGSLMRWLPEYGVGLIALGNVTYAGWGRAFDDAFDALARTGALRARVVQPSPALLRAQDAVSRLIVGWDDTLADAMAADNLFRDVPADRRRAQLADHVALLGACRPGEPIEAKNALRGTWRMACERGTLDVTITLAPTSPPRVQHWSMRPAARLDRTMAEAVAKVVPLVGSGDADAVSALVGSGPSADAVRDTLAAARPWGPCRTGDVVAGDGRTRATVALACEAGELWLALEVEANQRISRLSLTPGPDSVCNP